MDAIGVHFGFFSIHISQCYRRRSEDRLGFNDLTFESYGLDDWWPAFQGSLPNFYDPKARTTGYQALDSADLRQLRRFDNDFFSKILEQRDNCEEYQLWGKVLRDLREYIFRRTIPVSLAIFSEEINFTTPISEYTPWIQSQDRSSELARALAPAAAEMGFVNVQIFHEPEILRQYQVDHPDLAEGELLTIVGSQRSSIWRIDAPGRPPANIQNCLGLASLTKNLWNSSAKAIPDLLHLLRGYQGGAPEQLSRILDNWKRSDLGPALKRSMDQRPGSSMKKDLLLWVGGEGAYLLASPSALEKGERLRPLPEANSLHARGAAALAFHKEIKESAV
jgi:hypothetical protein